MSHLTALQMNNMTTLKGVGQKIINHGNLGKEYFDWILQGKRQKEPYTNNII